MRLFDWLKPSRTPVELTRDYVNINSSALAQILEGGKAVVLEEGQILVPQAKYPEAQRIATSLRDFPGDWVLQQAGHYVTHVPTGFMLWCCNGESGVAQWDGRKRLEYSEPEKRIIWKALEPLAALRPGPFGTMPKVQITGKRGIYWCVAEGHPWTGVGDSPAHAYRSWAQAVSVEQRKANPKQKLHVWSDPL